MKKNILPIINSPFGLVTIALTIVSVVKTIGATVVAVATGKHICECEEASEDEQIDI